MPHTDLWIRANRAKNRSQFLPKNQPERKNHQYRQNHRICLRFGKSPEHRLLCNRGIEEGRHKGSDTWSITSNPYLRLPSECRNNSRNRSSRRVPMFQVLVIWIFGHWDLFRISNFVFRISNGTIQQTVEPYQFSSAELPDLL